MLLSLAGAAWSAAFLLFDVLYGAAPGAGDRRGAIIVLNPSWRRALVFVASGIRRLLQPAYASRAGLEAVANVAMAAVQVQ